MSASLPPLLVFVLAVVAGGSALAVAVWNMRLAQRLAAVRRTCDEVEATLRRERQDHRVAQAAAEAHLASERELVDLKSRFVSMVSHEFRTPLGIIMSAAELLRNYRERLTPENQGELLEDIVGSTRRMSGLMEQVLLLGRVDAGKVAVQVAPVDLGALLARICDEQTSASAARCPIALRAGEDLAGAAADAGLLRHILSNLVSNAVKYSPAGATVTIEATRLGEDAVIRVVDRGIGIPEADQARLFEAFHRASNVGETPGSGLGLLIVKRCVDLHGGRIECRSRPGEGTTFTVGLPLFRAAQPVDSGADAAPRSIASRMVA